MSLLDVPFRQMNGPSYWLPSSHEIMVFVWFQKDVKQRRHFARLGSTHSEQDQKKTSKSHDAWLSYEEAEGLYNVIVSCLLLSMTLCRAHLLKMKLWQLSTINFPSFFKSIIFHSLKTVLTLLKLTWPVDHMDSPGCGTFVLEFLILYLM